MLVSIVLPMFNDEETIAECLSSLKNQSYDPKEIIAIDDGSSDRTYEIVNRITKGDSQISAIRIEHHGRSYARNVGLKLARGKLVFFAESDAKYATDYLKTAVKSFSDSKVGGVLVGGGVWEDGTYVSRCMHLEALLRNADLDSGRAEPESGWIYLKEILDLVDGFNERLNAGEDTDIGIKVRRSGYQIKWVGGSHWWFKSSKSLRDLMIRSYWFGKEEITGFFRMHPERFPWRKASIILFFVMLLTLSVWERIIFHILIAGLAIILVIKGAGIRRRGRGFIEFRDILGLLLLSVVRNLFFFMGIMSGWIGGILDRLMGTNHTRRHVSQV